MYELNGLGPCVRDESVNPPGATVPVGFQIALPTSAAGPRRKSSQGFQVKQHRMPVDLKPLLAKCVVQVKLLDGAMCG